MSVVGLLEAIDCICKFPKSFVGVARTNDLCLMQVLWAIICGRTYLTIYIVVHLPTSLYIGQWLILFDPGAIRFCLLNQFIGLIGV